MKITGSFTRIVERRSLVILVAVLAISAFAAWSVSRISVLTTMDTFLSPESEALQGYRAC
jgi:predicted RND superfamily exporter protein